jgi:hypothetical protein
MSATNHDDLPNGWERVVKVLRVNYHEPDVLGAKCIIASVAAHKLKHSVPVWPLAIAPPGSAKTDVLESLRGLLGVHFVDELTPKTFISGKVDERNRKRTRPASLLHRIGRDGILVAADFGTYTSDPKSLGLILAQQRRIYDGNYSREFGTDEHLEERDWQGRLTVLAGAVPEVDRHYAVFQRMGERYIRIRWPRAGGVEAAIIAISHNSELADELRQTVHGVLLPILEAPEIYVPALSSDMELRIASLGELIALSRSHVERDRYTREITDVPVTEGNTRLPQQLCQLARGSALSEGRAVVNEDDLALVYRVAFDSLPTARSAVLLALIHGRNPYTLGLPESTTHRALEDLQSVGLVADTVTGQTPTLTDKADELIQYLEPSMSTFPLLRIDIGKEGDIHSSIPFPKCGKAGKDGKIRGAQLAPSAHTR